MSNKQLIVLWIGVGLIVLMCLFPPWVRVLRMSGGTLREGYGYHCVFMPPPLNNKRWSPYLDTSRLIIQCITVAVLTGAGIYTLRAKGK